MNCVIMMLDPLLYYSSRLPAVMPVKPCGSVALQALLVAEGCPPDSCAALREDLRRMRCYAIDDPETTEVLRVGLS